MNNKNKKIDLLGVQEVADLLKWSKQRVSYSLARGNLPEPYARLAAGPVWLRSTIEEFKKSRSPGR